MKRILLTFLSLLALPTLILAESRVTIRVVTGDTIVVDGGQYVKLLGVMLSEDPEQSEKARKFLSSQLLGQEVEVETDGNNSVFGHKDKYGRLLAYIYRSSDNLFMNAALIRQGLAYVDSRNLHKMRVGLQMYQQEARKARQGIWEKELLSPEERAVQENRPLPEPVFIAKERDKTPDLLVEIYWAKKADPRFRTARTAEEAHFLASIYQEDVLKGTVSVMTQLRRNLATALTEHFANGGVQLRVETAGNEAEILRFIAKGMERKDADSFLAIPFNLELFSGLEFKEVVFTDAETFSYTYKVER